MDFLLKGNGSTLSLINPQLDNTKAANWMASEKNGTPGKLNDIYTKVEEDEAIAINNFYLSDNYPNPFNPTTNIRYAVPAIGAKQALPVQLKVYDVLGNEVATLVNEKRQPGSYEVIFDASGLSSGMYFYSLTANTFSSTKKMILLK